jgi:AmmeMemoRadiSam system protein B/AmmeMemoRadiSam system protein A
MKGAIVMLLVWLAAGLEVFWPTGRLEAAVVRPAVWAGKFYPAARPELEEMIARLIGQARRTPLAPAPKGQLKALILPHAGYVYSGLTAAHAACVLKRGQFENVLLLGPDHRVGFADCAVSAVDAYQTPLGQVPLAPAAARLREQKDLFRAVAASDDSEHCLEVLLPFLQLTLGSFQMVPVVFGPCDIEKVAAALDPLCDAKTLIVVSSDLSHYLPYDAAVARDQETIRMILDLNFNQLAQGHNRACGALPIEVLLHLARRHGWQAQLLHYSTSAQASGDKTAVVGYAAIAFYGDTPMSDQASSSLRLTAEQGQLLVRLARQTLMDRFDRPLPPAETQALKQALAAEAFEARCGTFVTLKLGRQLRGCIGNLTASETVVEGICQNAINAAFHDPRFHPLSAKEAEQVTIEVSVLTPPAKLAYRDGDDLIDKLRVNVDGVIIRKGYASATFLPQVWEQLPQPQDFLSHLCLKAGLAADEWRRGQLEVQTYQVQYFEEHP